MDSNNHDLNGVALHDEEPPAGPGARRRWPLAAAVVIVALAAVAGGIAVAGNFRSADPVPVAASTAAVVAPTESASLATTPPPTDATSEAAGPSASASAATSTAAPSAGAWRTFTTSNSKISFDYPADWQATQKAPVSTDFEGILVDVADETGVVIATLSFGPSGGIGGACQGPVPYTVLDSVEVNLPHRPAKGSVTPRFAFRALQESDKVTASFGLTDSPAVPNNMTCMFYNVVTGPEESPLFSFADAFQITAGSTESAPGHKGAKTFPSMDAARAYMQTPEYLKAKRMITSLRIDEG